MSQTPNFWEELMNRLNKGQTNRLSGGAYSNRPQGTGTSITPHTPRNQAQSGTRGQERSGGMAGASYGVVGTPSGTETPQEPASTVDPFHSNRPETYSNEYSNLAVTGGGGGGGAGGAWDRLNQNNRTNQLGEEFWKALQEQLNTGFDLSGAADVQETARNRNMQQVQNQSGMNRNSPAAQMYSQMMAGQDSTNLALLKQQQMQQKLDLLRQAYSQFWGMSAA